ncbi:MAG: hypothetical protein AB2L20_22365 [Mangrovibacterium sp.]
MKKLGKLLINPEKLMKNEELIDLRGGYGTSHYVSCKNTSGYTCGGFDTHGCSNTWWIEQYCKLECPDYGGFICV